MESSRLTECRAGDILEANYNEISRLEKVMRPTPESTKLEEACEFQEYKGVGKLEHKKVIITGGE